MKIELKILWKLIRNNLNFNQTTHQQYYIYNKTDTRKILQLKKYDIIYELFI